MKPTSPPTICLAVLLALTSAAQAVMISGSINFSSGAGGGIILQDSAGNITNHLASATGIHSWVFPEVEVGSGSFDAVPNGTSVSFSNAWVFDSPTLVTPLWTIAGPENFAFHPSSANIVFHNNHFLAIHVTGTLTGTHHDPTPANWWFTTQGVATQGKFSWSSTAAASPVPDGGSTLIAMVIGLLSLGGIRRFLLGN